MRIRPPIGSRKRRKIVGRGPGSGLGCTSGRGNKGQKVRSGYSKKRGFEGGQMPLSRRVPKRGFNNKKFEKSYQVVNICELNRYNDGDRVDYPVLLKDRLVNKKSRYIKLLAKGELTKKVHVLVHKASKKALEAVEKVGGKVEFLS